MLKNSLLLALLAFAMMQSGCVYRRMSIMSDPPGARVFVNNVEVGATPCDVPTNLFVDHGNYQFTLFKDGYEPLLVLQPVPAKPYEWFGIDLFTEVISPFPYFDRRVFAYQLQPVREKSGDELKQQGDAFRARGQAVGPPPPSQPR
jgi:hypothetical protein